MIEKLMTCAVFVFFCVVAFGCHTSKQTEATSKNKDEPKEKLEVSNDACVDKNNNLIWAPVTQSMLYGNDIELRETFKLFSIDAVLLHNSIEANFKKRKPFLFTFPVNINGAVSCMTFELLNSQTISIEVQERTGVYSFKGADANGSNSTLRLDFYPSKGLSAYFQISEHTILLERINLGTTKYYISYNKNDSKMVKKQFEK